MNPQYAVTRGMRAEYAAFDEALREMETARKNGESVCAAGNWFVDHYPLLTESAEQAENRLRGLPALPAEGGVPRALRLAREAASLPVEAAALRGLLESRAAEYRMAELWAFPTLLSKALLEKAAQAARELSSIQRGWRRADACAERYLESRDPKSLRPPAKPSDAFWAHLLLRLKEENADVPDALIPKDRSRDAVIETQTRWESMVRAEMEAAIVGLQRLARLDASKLVLSVSPVERALMSELAGIYPRMDDESRAVLRDRVEAVARASRRSESEVAIAALAFCAPRNGIERHVGWALTDGLPDFLASLKDVNPLYRLGVRLGRSGRVLYPWACVVGSLLVFIGMCAWLGTERAGLWPLMLLPSAGLWISALQTVLLRFVRPTRWLRLELPAVPDALRTLVVIPALLRAPDDARALARHALSLALSNPDRNIDWLILADAPDAAAAQPPIDPATAEALRDELSRIREGHGARIFTLWRARTYNRAQRMYVGWERKRGALSQLHALLLRGQTSSFLPGYDAEAVRERPYAFIITLDADTILPPAEARRMIGTLGHPINREKYAVIAPRMGTSLRSVHTRLQAVFGGSPGVDAYASAVSDVIQDVCGQGIFCGKGIYDIARFDAATRDLPENIVLSHDLLEGTLAGAGFSGELALYDGLPARYDGYAQRLHRWTRGDFQLLRWILQGRGVPPLGRFLMLENLRRELSGAFSALLLLAATLAGSLPAALLAVAAHFFSMLPGLLNAWRPGGLSQLGRTAGTLLCTWVLLPYEALLQLDAGARSLWRMLVSHRSLLSWTTAADADRRGAGRMDPRLWTGPILFGVALIGGWLTLGGGAGVLLALAGRGSLGAAFTASGAALRGSAGTLCACLACLLPFAAGPALAAWLSRPRRRPERMDSGEEADLRLQSRKIWRFFEDCVTAQDNFLPPDNIQLAPAREPAARTSPTNIGLYLLSSAAAYRLGHIDADEMRARMADTLAALERLEHWHGHPVNWVDTRTLESLRPRYVSSVDSGNLAACLWSCAAILRDAARESAFPPQRLRGLRDTLALAAGEADGDPALVRAMEALSEEGFPAHAIYEARRALEEVGGTPGRRAERPAPAADGWLSRAFAELTRAAQLANAPRQREPEEIARFEDLAARMDAYVRGMDFAAFYDGERHLFSIGFDLEHERMSDSYYDLLASEARTLIFLSVAKGDVPLKAWKAPGRPLTRVGREAALLSWSGTCFEYAMPQLWLDVREGSLLFGSARAAAHEQCRRAVAPDAPFGVSESGYYAFDLNRNYQYRAFGVPTLSMDGGQPLMRVVAPYASFLMLEDIPRPAARNIARMRAMGWDGPYGLFEAADYTRTAAGEAPELVKSYMAHHLGMSLCALTNALMGAPLRKAFMNRARAQAMALLLEERMPAGLPRAQRRLVAHPDPALFAERRVRRRVSASPRPVATLLSGGGTSMLLTPDGRGWIESSGLMLARWRDDPRWWHGLALRVRVDGNKPWSVYGEGSFEPGAAVFQREADGIHARLSVYVSPEDGSVVHRLTLRNEGNATARVEATSFFEATLCAQDADEAHATFQNLFIQTQALPESGAVLAARRPRSGTYAPCVLHAACMEREEHAAFEWETDRSLFLGRGNDATRAVGWEAPLSGKTGAVLDPCVAVRRAFRMEAGEETEVFFVTRLMPGVSAAREVCAAGALRARAEAAQSMARAHAQAQFTYLSMDGGSWRRAMRALAHLALPGLPAGVDAIGEEKPTEVGADARAGDVPESGDIAAANRAEDRAGAGAIGKDEGAAVSPISIHASESRSSADSAAPASDTPPLPAAMRGQSALWAMALSGDLPLMVVRIASLSQMRAARQAVQIHDALGMMGFRFDLVLLAQAHNDYFQPLCEQLRDLTRAALMRERAGQPGGAHVIVDRQWEPERVHALLRAARLRLDGARDLDEQLSRLNPRWTNRGLPALQRLPLPAPASLPDLALAQDNGIGGFLRNGGYRIHRDASAPWANMLAGENLSFMATERGAGPVWARNSREERLTPWYGDPVTEPVGEAVYLADPVRAQVWSVTKAPCGGESSRATHLPGATIYESGHGGIRAELAVWADGTLPVKVSRLTLENPADAQRELTVAYCADLAPAPHKAAHMTRAAVDAAASMVYAANLWSDGVAYIAAPGVAVSFETDRDAFLGEGGMECPDRLLYGEKHVWERPGAAGFAALWCRVTIPARGSARLDFLMGKESDLPAARRRAMGFDALASWQSTRALWERRADMARLQSPSPHLDALMRGWLPAQIVGARWIGRAGYYQSGGAYGFRDQLQDMLSMILSDPQEARAHLLRCAAHQFEQGDVQHWWHPPRRGVRTRISDDLLFLPYALAEYVEKTGDEGILDARAPWLVHEELPEGVEDWYGEPDISGAEDPLLEHGLRAIDRACRFGAHGLPLMGGGDWNDAMNHVGLAGKGESVWLAFFLCVTIERFARCLDLRGRRADRERILQTRAQVAAAIEEYAWDGAWYRRAFFDDGSVMGSAQNEECQIDAVAQAWAVLSGVAPEARGRQAALSAFERLYDPETRILRLLTPAFDGKGPDPGYIRGYVPGVRENGGQYTHGAIWLGMALLRVGEAEKAMKVLECALPLAHAATPDAAQRYKVEPYVVPADIYGEPPNVGRGGWTWYTGSASWLWKAVVEELVGVKVRQGQVFVEPRLPEDWPQVEVSMRILGEMWRITCVRVGRGAEVSRVIEDPRGHAVRVEVGGGLEADVGAS